VEVASLLRKKRVRRARTHGESAGPKTFLKNGKRRGYSCGSVRKEKQQSKGRGRKQVEKKERGKTSSRAPWKNRDRGNLRFLTSDYAKASVKGVARLTRKCKDKKGSRFQGKKGEEKNFSPLGTNSKKRKGIRALRLLQTYGGKKAKEQC